MLNWLKKYRFPLREKVGSVSCKSTFRIEAEVGTSPGQFEKKWAEESFAWIFGSEQMDSDPLIPKTIWELSGSELLYGTL